MIKKVVYRDKRDNLLKEEEFIIKGHKAASGLVIDRDSEAESINFIKEEHVEYVGSYYRYE